MAQNRTIEAPDFDMIRKQSGYAVEDAIHLLWEAFNAEITLRRQGTRDAKEKIEGKAFADPRTSNINNYDAQGAQTVYWTGASAFDLTGIRNGAEGRVIIFSSLGAGTVTFKHDSASSDTLNKMLMADGTDTAVATNATIVLQYLNNRWRELIIA